MAPRARIRTPARFSALGTAFAIAGFDKRSSRWAGDASSDHRSSARLQPRSPRVVPPGLWPLPSRRPGPGGPAAGRGLTGQGHRRLRGRAQQHAGRLRAGRGSQRQRRFLAQLELHAGEPGRHARAPGRRDPWQYLEHQERRRRHGHRDPAAVRAAGQPDRRRGERSGRRQVAARWHAARDPAAGRRRRSLRRGARCAQRRRLRGRGRGGERHPRGADRGPDPRRGHRRARGRVLPRRAEPDTPKQTWDACQRP